MYHLIIVSCTKNKALFLRMVFVLFYFEFYVPHFCMCVLFSTNLECIKEPIFDILMSKNQSD